MTTLTTNDDPVDSIEVDVAEPLVEAGVEVIIPAGGLTMLLFARDRFTVHNAVVLNGIAVAVAAAEVALKLCRQTDVAVSRQGTVAKAARTRLRSSSPTGDRRVVSAPETIAPFRPGAIRAVVRAPGATLGSS